MDVPKVGGSMHVTDLNANFVAATPIVGSTIPIAVGYAMAQSMTTDGDIDCNKITASSLGTVPLKQAHFTKALILRH